MGEFSGSDLHGAVMLDALLTGVTWSSQTVWPSEMAEDVQRGSGQIGPDA
jgi:hypothetical protein